MYWIGTSVLTQYSNLWGGLGGSGGAVQPFVLTPGSLHAFPGTASLSHDQRRFSSRLHGIKDKPRGGGAFSESIANTGASHSPYHSQCLGPTKQACGPLLALQGEAKRTLPPGTPTFFQCTAVGPARAVKSGTVQAAAVPLRLL